MRKTTREEATAIIAIAGVVLSLIVARNVGSWLDPPNKLRLGLRRTRSRSGSS